MKRAILYCPYCGGIENYQHGYYGKGKRRRRRYKCRYCDKTFGQRTGTPLFRSRLNRSEWEQASRLFCLRGGISGTDIGAYLKRNAKTGQRVIRILRRQTAKLPVHKLTGINETDETSITKEWIWGCVSREQKKLVLRQVQNRNGLTLTGLICKYTHPRSWLFSDEWGGYRDIDHLRIHYTVNHSKEFVSTDFPRVHTNTCEGAWGLIKPLARHIYRGIPKSTLPEFLKEFMFRYNIRDYKTRLKVMQAYLNRKFHT